MAWVLLLLSLVLSTVAGGSAAAPDQDCAARDAGTHYARALQALERDDLDYRRSGLRDLEEAVRLAPTNMTYRLTLAQAYFAGGYYNAARRCYTRVAQAESSAAYLGLGLLWRHDWLESRERRSLDRAVDALMTAAWLRPMDTDAWLLLVPLYLEQGRLEEAASAAFGALVSDSKRLEAHLAVAATLSHLGVVGVGDSIFRATIPRLPRGLRARYERAAPLPADAPATLIALGAGAGEADPDVLDRLETWSRLTEQFVLLPGPGTHAGETDADLRERFGSPRLTRSGQMGPRLEWGRAGAEGGRSPEAVREYPELGVRMVVMDRLLALRPDLSQSRSGEAGVIPGPALAAMYARILDALGGAQPRGAVAVGAPAAAAPAVTGK